MSLVALSVVIPCRNEKDCIEACIHSIFDQERLPGGDFEIIVADGMSEDGTRDILKRLADEDPRLRVVDNPKKITPSGMNHGIRAARGQYIAIMGAHNRYAPDYLKRCIEVLKETGADNVGGALLCDSTFYLQRAIAAAHQSMFSAGEAKWHNPEYEGPTDTVFGGAYRREVFDRIGFFDEELVRNQDDELNLRLTRSGGKIWKSPCIRSWYHPRKSMGALFRQYLQYGYWKVRVIQKHKLPASIRQVVPGFFLLTMIALAVASLRWSSALWLLFMLGAAYLCFIGIGAIITAARYGWDLLPVLIPVFACYHFGYGLGFIKGINDFMLFRRHPSDRMILITRK